VRVAFPAAGNDLDAPLDSRFGRSPWFLVYELESDSFVLVDNRQNANAAQGAGVEAAQAIVQAGAEALIAGRCGPKAFHVLSAAGVTVHTSDALTVRAALEAFRGGKLPILSEPNAAAHPA
jgi:predicted Fe-Mo cluster-binding NifX family protein